MGKENNRSISGEWLGIYYYSGTSQPNGFQAVFIESSGAVEGNILDDGRLGEAQVTGTYAAPSVRFTKIYRATDPVKYIGTLSDDGNSISGTWQINAACFGTWSAWRNAEDEDDDKLQREDDMSFDVEEETEKEKQRPMVAPAKAK
jgi:hypothetical protein